MELSYLEALEARRINRFRSNFPANPSDRCLNGALWPHWRPKFDLPLAPGRSCFTIGSCFARNIEDVLVERGITVPVADYHELEFDPTDLRQNVSMNEYNSASIAQRIHMALDGRAFDTRTLVAVRGGLFDMTLSSPLKTTREVAMARRARIDGIYTQLAGADLVIVTLGYVEAWFDTLTGTWLNQMPPPNPGQAEPDRFRFHRLDAAQSLAHLAPAFDRLGALGRRIVLTVSPVPLQSTFTGQDCVIANEYSKAVLRVVAEALCERPFVDYFPSYEIVRSMGLSGFDEDNIHVRRDVVERITDLMVQGASPPEAP